MNIAIRINGGAPGAQASVSASSTVTGTLDSLDGVNFVEWEVGTTDELSGPYVLSTSGAKNENFSVTSGGAGSGVVMRATANGGLDPQTNNPSPSMTATCKFYVPTAAGLEVGCAAETTETNASYGTTGLVNQGIRFIGASGFGSYFVSNAVHSSADITPPGGTTTRFITSGSIAQIGTGTNRNYIIETQDNGTSSADYFLIKHGIEQVFLRGKNGDGNQAIQIGPEGTGFEVDFDASQCKVGITAGTPIVTVTATDCFIQGRLSGTWQTDTLSTGVVTFDCSASCYHEVTVNGTASLHVSNVGTTGALYFFAIKQDGTGGRAVSVDASKLIWPNAVAQPFSTSPNAVDILVCVADGTGLLDIVRFFRGDGEHFTSLAVGPAHTALSGDLRLGGAGSPAALMFRNNANSGDLNGIGVSTDQINIGDAAATGTIISGLDVTLLSGATGVFINGGASGPVQLTTGGSGGVLIDPTAGPVDIQFNGASRIKVNATGIGYNGAAPSAKPTVTGSRGGNAALASLLTALATLGHLTDSST